MLQKTRIGQRWRRWLAIGLASGSSGLMPLSGAQMAIAANPRNFCRFVPGEVTKKERLREAALSGEAAAQTSYRELVERHSAELERCRQETWPRRQAIWLRLYPCDLSPGVLDTVFDNIVNEGYNQVYVEVFYNGQVLLPAANNPTPWPPVVRTPGAENADLLAKAIAKGRDRGMKVYAWLFTMNFGYSYSQLSDRQDALARNSHGEDTRGYALQGSEVFVDPYSRTARSDYARLVSEVLKREPDGVLFDYVRYPRGSGEQTVVTEVENLWVHSPASRQALLARAINAKGQLLIQRYLERGSVTVDDIRQIDEMEPKAAVPLWQGRTTLSPADKEEDSSLWSRQRLLQQQLWHLSVAHAAQGIIDFLTLATQPVRDRRLPAGAVFFPEANQLVGSNGFDSRLQPWSRFPPELEWHPMSYAVCGRTDCIVERVRRTVQKASPQTQVIPALAGLWGQDYKNRPSLEAQMRAIQQQVPEVDAISHFGYAWQHPEGDRDRKFCDLSQIDED